MIDSFFGLLTMVGVVVLIVTVTRLRERVRLLEREIGALRSFVSSLPEKGKAQPKPAGATEASAAATAATAATAVSSVEEAGIEDEPGLAALRQPAAAAAASATGAARQEMAIGSEAVSDEPDASTPDAEPAAPVSEPASTGADTAAEEAKPAEAAPARQRPDIETALGTRWAVWIGGIALALGGIFLVRYTLEVGLFGPGVRLLMAALFGLALLAAGEFVRRTGFRVPVPGIAGAYIPAILTAAGAFTLFGTVYAAHGIYGFIGPAAALFLLGAVGIATLALALVHGQALAGVGLLGALATPVLVASQSPNAWGLFGYLAVVLVASIAIARIRRWLFLAAAAFAGVGLWCLVYLAEVEPADLWIVLFINAVMLATLALVWIGGRDKEPWETVRNAVPAAVPALFVALSAAVLLLDPALRPSGGLAGGTALFAAMVAVAVWRAEALPLLFGAAIGAALVFLRVGLSGTFAFELMGEPVEVDGFAVLPSTNALLYPGLALTVLFLVAGLWRARALIGSPMASATWTGAAAAVPFVILCSLWIALGNPDIDLRYAFAALLLAGLLAAGAGQAARRENPASTGGPAVSILLAGGFAALLAAIHMAFGPGLTTILAGAAAMLPALATRRRAWPALGWLSAAAVVMVLVRVAGDPTIVGWMRLGTTPVFNALLPGYGIPALAFGFAAWQLARTTGGRPRLAMEASALFFALLTLAMLVRHAMHGGIIDTGTLTLAEQAIYTLIALAAGAILISLDLKAPSPVLRHASLGIGVFSVAAIATQHLLLLNPLFTDESTGGIPFFNLLFLAYLLPAAACAALAWYAQGRRPPWYSLMLGIAAAALAFAYATLSVRRLFQGEHIGFWSGMEPLETYSYSALWLVIGVGLLAAGVRTGSYLTRAASGAVIAIAVAKVFLFDMSALEGVLRALSFIGLGAVLIGIGLFYQRLLARAAAG
jgi:uncharacterized membrane protein